MRPVNKNECTAMTSSPDTATILELLASRICHDLVSPVGAVNNGVEFMEDMGADGIDEAVELIGYSAGQAAAKLQAFRLAYGAGGRDKNIKPEDIQRAFSALIKGEGKIRQTWDPFGSLGPDPLPPGFCKMLMCSLMLAQECLPKGGTVSAEPGDGAQTLITAQGQDVLVRDGVEDALSRKLDVADLDPRLVHPYAISVLADAYGYRIKILEKTPEKVVFALNCPAAAA